LTSIEAAGKSDWTTRSFSVFTYSVTESSGNSDKSGWLQFLHDWDIVLVPS